MNTCICKYMYLVLVLFSFLVKLYINLCILSNAKEILEELFIYCDIAEEYISYYTMETPTHICI